MINVTDDRTRVRKVTVDLALGRNGYQRPFPHMPTKKRRPLSGAALFLR
jgi:hypothetical protein